jgi:predicted HNH restriction endonuclease
MTVRLRQDRARLLATAKSLAERLRLNCNDRSRLLAIECKIRDNYGCQVCGLRFEDTYGRLGVGYAEAHHRVPLSQLSEHV